MPKKGVKERIKMPMQSPMVRIHNFNEVVLGYTKEQALREATRCPGCKYPPCMEQCPIGQNIKSYVTHIAKGNFVEALRVIRETNPLPTVCGRICPHPCEDVCIIGKIGDPVAIAWLKRFASDAVSDKIEEEKSKVLTGKRVAIIGSGPAGLTVAINLARRGHSVTIFEELPVAGGMLAVGIPEYRLPRAIVNEEIQRIKKLGVEIELNTPVRDVDGLFKQGYHAVFIGIGAHGPKWMNIPGEDLEGVIHAVSFLRDVNLGKEVKLGKKVAVIGGGNVAMDAVRTAKRLGSDSFIVYRRAREQMPADPGEVEEAEEEGIQLNFLTNPVKVHGKAGKVVGLECLRMKLGEPDESGRKRPIPIEGTEFISDADTIIEAISQQPIVSWLKESGLSINRWNCIDVDEEDGTYATSRPGIYAAGDVVTGPKTVVEAIATAKKAARAIDLYLQNL